MRTLIKKWLISAIASAFSKGFDSEHPFWSRGVLVFTGPQAVGKTSFFRWLVPLGLFAEGVSLDINSKDDIRRSISCWVCEFGELDATFRRSDIARLKAFTSSTCDDIRRPYAESSEKLSRRTVFCASVNRSDFLQDDTGSSRWWVVPVIGFKSRNHLSVNQLWAQIYQLYLAGEDWWLTPEEERELAQSNEEFEPSSKYDDMVPLIFDFSDYNWEDTQNTIKMTATEVAKICCGANDVPHGDSSIIGKTLRRLTKHNCERTGDNRFYRLPRRRISQNTS